jgi:hypothetical protein
VADWADRCSSDAASSGSQLRTRTSTGRSNSGKTGAVSSVVQPPCACSHWWAYVQAWRPRLRAIWCLPHHYHHLNRHITRHRHHHDRSPPRRYSLHHHHHRRHLHCLRRRRRHRCHRLPHYRTHRLRPHRLRSHLSLPNTMPGGKTGCLPKRSIKAVC